MGVEHRKVQLIRPPILVRSGPAALGSGGGDRRVLALARAPGRVLVVRRNRVVVSHVSSSPSSVFPASGSSARNRGRAGAPLREPSAIAINEISRCLAVCPEPFQRRV